MVGWVGGVEWSSYLGPKYLVPFFQLLQKYRKNISKISQVAVIYFPVFRFSGFPVTYVSPLREHLHIYLTFASRGNCHYCC